MARRLLYKVRGPEACNFPVTPELAAELDALTAEQVLQQLRCGGAGPPLERLLLSRVVPAHQNGVGQVRCGLCTIACRDKAKSARRVAGVSAYRRLGKWQAVVHVRQPYGRSKNVFLGLHATEQQAAERVSAAAYILGDRCGCRRCVCPLCRRCVCVWREVQGPPRVRASCDAGVRRGACRWSATPT